MPTQAVGPAGQARPMWSDLRVTLTDLLLPAPCAGCGTTSAASVCPSC
ncbi:MAG: hypothetical protein H0X00_21520, partial [Sporichthya sp.]|nr:hypothetical protein [Sporichthya sp.]